MSEKKDDDRRDRLMIVAIIAVWSVCGIFVLILIALCAYIYFFW